jgi:HEPN domain-containing protein
MNRTKFFAVICVVLLTVISCAKPPIAEMDSAKEAVLRAENDPDAAVYASGILSRAQNALRQMQLEADSKRYDAAKTHAAEAVSLAERAITEGKAAAARTKIEAEELLLSLGPALDEAEKGIQAARNSNLNLDFENLDKDMDNARQNNDLAVMDQSMGKYQDALEKGKTARSTIGDINQKLASAANAVRKK